MTGVGGVVFFGIDGLGAGFDDKVEKFNFRSAAPNDQARAAFLEFGVQFSQAAKEEGLPPGRGTIQQVRVEDENRNNRPLLECFVQGWGI